MKEKNDILVGFHSVFEALNAGRRKFYKILISKKRFSKRGEQIKAAARLRKIQIDYIEPNVLDRMAGTSNHQGIAAKTSFFPVRKAAQIPGLIQKKKEPCFILILESIEDPRNLGALIRTAMGAGVEYILMPKDRSASPSSTVSRSSAGAMEHADIYMITNTAAIVRSLKENRVWVSGLDANGDTSLFNADLKGDIALVIGGENKGIRPVVRKACDFLLSIPNKGNVNSLNASVAGGIAMYEALRQRN